MTNHYNKEIFVKDYFEIHTHYSNFYEKQSNCKILILMQVGSFHECYSTDTEGPDLNILGESLDMIVTQKNKNKPLSTSNPKMMGFPSYIVDDVMEKILNNGYTVVRIDQTSEPPNPKREVVGIYSPSTFISTQKNPILVCIAFDAIKLKTTSPLLCIGIAAYYMMTGEGCVYEAISTTNDTMFALDSIIRFLEKYPPSEIVYYQTKQLSNYFATNTFINRMTLEDILKYIGLTNSINKYYLNNTIDTITNAKYQQNLIQKIFNDTLDSINLHAYNMGRLALVGLLEFTSNNMPLLLDKLSKPEYFTQSNTLFLGNRAIEQLDIIPLDNKPKTLYNILCQTKTPMGRRLLKNNLCNPSIDSSVLLYRYNAIEQLLSSNIFESISNNLNNIVDLPKLVRKMELKKINPNEFSNFFYSLQQINKTFVYIIKYANIAKCFSINKNINESLIKCINFIETTFDIEYISKINYINYKEETKNYILNNKYPKINELEECIMLGNNFMVHLLKQLEKYIEDKKTIKTGLTQENSSIILKYNDRDGHYMLLTKRRSKILQENLKKIENIKIGAHCINISNLEFIDLPRSNNTKICCKDISKISLNVVELKASMAKELKEIFITEVFNFIEEYKDTISNTIEKIAMLDFLNSGAIVAYKQGYTKPIITESEISYFTAKELRHPIIEIINNDTIYSPHDISIGKDKKGILLYGINSSGKSTLMKSIGLNIVMAQIGYYVAAKEFIYSPYHYIFTRIIGVDNIYRGMSSFMVEMMELMAILKRNTMKTLVLGDEICRGTEEKSANIIVAYMLETLVQSNTSFITATHLHSIASLPSIANLQGLSIMHLKILYDDINDCLIYSRELSEGQGDKYYGVMVAKYLMKNTNFNNRTKELEMEYEDFSLKKSNYNKDIYMLECAICKGKNNLETHHIHFQKNCDKIKVIDKPHIKKNKLYNLVILCSKCHDDIDRNTIIVYGWIQTSNGIVLDWKNTQIV